MINTVKMLIAVMCLVGGISSFAKDTSSTKTKSALTKVTKEKAELAEPIELNKLQKKVTQDSFIHPKANVENWVFSGIVESEKGRQYGYYFIIVRQEAVFDVYTKITRLEDGKVVLSRQLQAPLAVTKQQGINFKLKNAFLRYNAIADSWLFGIDDKSGFNFRVEALKAATHQVEHVGNLAFYNLQSTRINGHITTEGKSQFVTAKNAWLSHQWRNAPSTRLEVKRLLCRLENNKGFLLERVRKNNNIVFNSSLLLDARGQSQPVTQFSAVSKNISDQWLIELVSPPMTLTVNTPEPMQLVKMDDKLTMYSGVAKTKNKTRGFCLILDDRSKPEVKPASAVS